MKPLSLLVLNSLEGGTTPVKVIAQHFTIFEKFCDTSPVIVFNSLERKDDPCKSDSQHIALFEKT